MFFTAWPMMIAAAMPAIGLKDIRMP